MSTRAAKMPASDWDAAADGWHRHGALVRCWLQSATVAMLDAAGVGPGQRVLDIAAGAGDQTLDIARRVGPAGQVLATDLSSVILERAEAALAVARAHGEQLATVRTQVADAQALALSDEGFDAAVCRLGLMFCVVPLAALRAAHDALAPGGRFAALVFGGPAGNPCITTLVKTALEAAGMPAGDPFTPGTLLSLGRPAPLHEMMLEAGFRHVTVRTIDAPMQLESVDVYVDFVRCAGSPVMRLVDALPTHRREAAWSAMADRLAQFKTADGWVGPNELLLVSGVRPTSMC